MARIYLDNAATTLHKPPQVAEAVLRFLRSGSASAGRGAYREALAAAAVLRDCRERALRLVGGEADDACVFTLNCTDALNTALKGWLRPGDHVVATRMEHNSVLRPLHELGERMEVRTTYVPADPRTGLVRARAIEEAIEAQTRLVVLSHASNVTGALQPLAETGEICRRRGIPFLVDAAQSCGHVPIDVRAMGIDFLAAPGHKGLLGPLGTGFLYVRAGRVAELRPLREGGTGSASDLPVQPADPPDRYEAGSHNVPGLAGLAAALSWILETGVERLRRHEESLCEAFLAALEGRDAVTIHGPSLADGLERRVGVFSIRIEGWVPGELAAALEERSGVLTRAGIHCAPFAHQTIGTLESGGTTRLSCGALTTEGDVLEAARAIATLAAERQRLRAVSCPACAAP